MKKTLANRENKEVRELLKQKAMADRKKSEKAEEALRERRERMSPYTRCFWDAIEGQWPEEKFANILAEIERISLLVFEIIKPPAGEQTILLSNHGATVANDRGTGKSGGDLPSGPPSDRIVRVPYQVAYDSIKTMFDAVQDIISCEIIACQILAK